MTTGQTRLLGTTPAINIQALAWSPDGRYILVDRFGPEGQRNGHDTFLLVATNGAGIRRVSDSLAAALSSGQNMVGWGVDPSVARTAALHPWSRYRGVP